MAYFKKKPTYCHMTDADKERIRRMEETSEKTYRKVKALATYSHPKIKAVITKYFYGKDKEEVEANVKEDIKWFQKNDKAWKLSKLEFMIKENTEKEEN